MSIFRTDRLAHPTLAWIFPLAMLVGSCSAEAGRMTPPTSAGKERLKAEAGQAAPRAS